MCALGVLVTKMTAKLHYGIALLAIVLIGSLPAFGHDLSLEGGWAVDSRQSSVSFIMSKKGTVVEIGIWKPGTPKPKDPEIRRRTVREGAIGGTVTEKSWYYFRLPFDKSFISGGLTLALVILPIIIIASQESLRSVSPSLREASLGLGATTWQTVRNVSLPAAIPGMSSYGRCKYL